MTNEELREKIQSVASADEAWHIIENEILQRVDLANQAAQADKAIALSEEYSKGEALLSKAREEYESKLAEATTRDAANTAEINALTTERDGLKAALEAEQAHHLNMMDRIKAGWSELAAHFEKHAANVSVATTTLSDRTQTERAARKQQLLDEAAKL
jgi:hypothetical protein